jgi:hypothetical protein
MITLTITTANGHQSTRMYGDDLDQAEEAYAEFLCQRAAGATVLDLRDAEGDKIAGYDAQSGILSSHESWEYFLRKWDRESLEARQKVRQEFGRAVAVATA